MRAWCAVAAAVLLVAGCSGSDDRAAEDLIAEQADAVISSWEARSGIEWSGQDIASLALPDDSTRDDERGRVVVEVLDWSGRSGTASGAEALVRYTARVSDTDAQGTVAREPEPVTRCVDFLVGADGDQQSGSWSFAGCPKNARARVPGR